MTQHDSATDSVQGAAEAAAPATDSPTAGVSRRRFLGGAGTATAAAAGGLVVGAAGALAVGAASAPAAEPEPAPGPSESQHEFFGAHQAGIMTPPQDHLVFAAFDVTATSPTQLQLVLAKWSAAMAQMCAGKPIGKVEPNRAQGIPVDTGEAFDMGPQGLTLTLGFGPGLFDKRFGLEKFKPKDFADLPAMAGESLKPAFSGGDLCIQACANDPQVAYHAVRNLARMAREQVTTRWTMMGFGRASAGPSQKTPRNLMGFKDGTRNVSTEAEYGKFVWTGSEAQQSWMEGGSYLVARKIHMMIETWDEDHIGDQHAVFGRTKAEGAPLGGKVEHDTPDFAAVVDGQPVIPSNSHIALAAHENNGGTKILRRGYNFTDGLDSVGRLDAGLFFISYQRDPAQFVKLQSKLGRSDRLNEYIRHVGSAVFAIPAGLSKAGDYYGNEFFG